MQYLLLIYENEKRFSKGFPEAELAEYRAFGKQFAAAAAVVPLPTKGSLISFRLMRSRSRDVVKVKRARSVLVGASLLERLCSPRRLPIPLISMSLHRRPARMAPMHQDGAPPPLRPPRRGVSGHPRPEQERAEHLLRVFRILATRGAGRLTRCDALST